MNEYELCPLVETTPANPIKRTAGRKRKAPVDLEAEAEEHQKRREAQYQSLLAPSPLPPPLPLPLAATPMQPALEASPQHEAPLAANPAAAAASLLEDSLPQYPALPDISNSVCAPLAPSPLPLPMAQPPSVAAPSFLDSSALENMGYDQVLSSFIAIV